MGSQVDKIRVSYSDFIRLCHVEDPENWVPGLRVALDGVWVKNISGDSLLSPDERSWLSEHPDGDPSRPIVSFPCTLGDIRARLWDLSGGGFIEPFELATFIAKKLDQGESVASKASLGQLNRRTGEREEILRAALAVLWHFPSQKRNAVALARQVEEKAGLFWPNTSEPPFQHRALTALLSEALKLPGK